LSSQWTSWPVDEANSAASTSSASMMPMFIMLQMHQYQQQMQPAFMKSQVEMQMELSASYSVLQGCKPLSDALSNRLKAKGKKYA